MRFSASFAVFRANPAEQDLSRARRLAHEAKTSAAEAEYRSVLAAHPDLAAGWIELVELLRQGERHEAALEVAMQAEAHFGPDAAMPLVLRGAALSELGRTREALQALEAALERDGNLALAWHELAYAAFRVGEFSRALLALDRAFALEPHVDTLLLRGRILREAGQYDAAEIAFEGAEQATDHDILRRDAEREKHATRRAASLGGKRPASFTPREKIFVATGSAAIDDGEPGAAASAGPLAACLAALPALVEEAGWKPSVVAGATPADIPLAEHLARALGAKSAPVASIDPTDRPLVVTLINDGGATWAKLTRKLERWSAGTTFALLQRPNAAEPADLIGAQRSAPAARLQAAAAAIACAPERALKVTETARLIASALAPWRRRCAGREPV